MKTKKSDLVAKIFLAAVIVILVGLLIAWMVGVFKDKKQDLNSGTEKIDQAINSMAEFDLLVYDGDTISGETLVELISDFRKKEVYVSVGVETLDEKENYYNYNYSSTDRKIGAAIVTPVPPTSKSDLGYITPSGNFLGEIIKNSNNEIVCLKFTQQQ